MDESVGAQYALQVALQTLKERCEHFQQKIAFLEEENMNLRLSNSNKSESRDSSLSEVDVLKERIAKLTQQKVQLRDNIQMVSNENQQLWARLIKMTKAKESLGSHLSKINDTLNQHTSNAKTLKNNSHAPVVRSKTFTVDEPHTKIVQKNNTVDEEDSLYLEDISLKLINNLVKEKSELELQCTQMTEMQNSDVTNNKNSFGFNYSEDDLEEVTYEEIEKTINEIKLIKEALITQRDVLKRNLKNLGEIEGSRCTLCNGVITSQPESTKAVADVAADGEEAEIARQLDSLTRWGTPEDSANFMEKKTASIPTLKPLNSRESLFETSKICPMCSKIYPPFIDFQEFHSHVENHFMQDGPQDNFEML